MAPSPFFPRLRCTTAKHRRLALVLSFTSLPATQRRAIVAASRGSGSTLSTAAHQRGRRTSSLELCSPRDTPTIHTTSYELTENPAPFSPKAGTRVLKVARRWRRQPLSAVKIRKYQSFFGSSTGSSWIPLGGAIWGALIYQSFKLPQQWYTWYNFSASKSHIPLHHVSIYAVLGRSRISILPFSAFISVSRDVR